MALNIDSLSADPEEFGAYLSKLSADKLPVLEAELVKRFSTLRADGGDTPTPELVTHLNKLSTQIQSIRQYVEAQAKSAVQAEAVKATEATKVAMANLDAVVFGNKTDEDAKETETASGVDSLAEVLATALATAVDKVSASAEHEPRAVVASARRGNLNAGIRNMKLGDIKTPNPALLPARREAVLVASSEGRGGATTIDGIGDLVSLMGNRARMMSVTNDAPNYVAVASLQRDFRYRLNLDSTPEEINDVLEQVRDVNALVAAGGWCAPSEISYDFFNIVCEDGGIDLPSVGVLNRGGFRWPVSPSLADVLASATPAWWTWTEEDDEDAVTSDSVVKTCARVECPTFDEVRAHCDGLCVTAGNLTDFAYPELIQNFLRLVMAGRFHLTNQSIILQMAGASTGVTLANTQGATAAILSAIELQATDYRERFHMCEDAILEVVFPRWVFGVIRADLSNRTGVNLLNVTNDQIADWFDLRGIRAQFVADWQSGFVGSPIGSPAAIPTVWPTSVQFMLYAPGTFVRGQGLQLDLGVVRDSVLNETNDHTAAWMEDCYAVAQVGHESRLVTVNDLCVAGTTGAGEISCA